MSTATWWLRSAIVRAMYWSAILLPVIYIPLLLTRLHTTDELLLFLVLFGLHIVTLIGGRSHRREVNT
jgi:4-amino-4-deoxy-L-arabinose transferase-like glycosyltransferase